MVTEDLNESRTGLRLVVLQAASLCNLNCSYCYVPGRLDSARMSDAVIAAAAAFVFAFAPDQRSFRFLWHAGEPLAVGLPFYRRAFALIGDLAPPGRLVSHSIQTNGTLISDGWCELFRDYGVSIGLSIDGPPSLHNLNRRSWAGQGSHTRVMRGYRLLRKHDINPPALCVLTRDSLAHPDEIYDFFVESGFTSVGFNVDEAEAANSTSSLTRDAQAKVLTDYRAFIRRLWRRWREDNGRLHIREFYQDLSCIRAFQANQNFVREPDEVIPFGIVTILRDGSVSTFAPELASTSSHEYADFVIGNVLTDDPGDIRSGDAFAHLARDVARGRESCKQQCPYYALCGGGFQSNRMAEKGSLLATETMTCRVHRKSLVDVVLDELLRESEALAK